MGLLLYNVFVRSARPGQELFTLSCTIGPPSHFLLAKYGALNNRFAYLSLSLPMEPPSGGTLWTQSIIDVHSLADQTGAS